MGSVAMRKGVNTARRHTLRPKVKFHSKVKGKSTTTTRNAKARLKRPAEHPVCLPEESESSSSSNSSCTGEENEAKGMDGSGVDIKEHTVEEDPFAYVGETSTDVRPAGRGELCELHSYDSRLNSKGERIVLRTGSKYEFDEEDEKSPEAALVMTRYVSSGKVYSTALEIKSSYIKKALKEVIGSYPGVNIDSEGSIILVDKPQCLFHYRHELKQYALDADDATIKEHVTFCLKYMERAMHKELSAYKDLMQTEEAIPRTNYEDLWMAFKPGALLYKKDYDAECVYKFEYMYQEDDEDESEYWVLELKRVESDGKVFGLTDKGAHVHRFEGYKALTDLVIFPLALHKEYNRVYEELLLRGRKYVSLSGVHYRKYDGVFISTEEAFWGHGVKQARHRVMIDGNEYNVNHRPHRLQFAHDCIIETGPGDSHDLSEEHLLMCYHRVPGFSLTTKTWGYFNVKQIQDIEFNSTAFDGLALAQEKKDMIAALVRAGQGSAENYDDMIKGKGKGIIFLLHGPPGVGKTFTAESIAEYLQRPLYTVNCSDLGVGRSAETHLSAALSLATKWNSIVLIDEADVFMAERSLNDLPRNELVSILLRVLEYFEGILFLTTNRAETIDPAFQSRIHCSLAYPNLSTEAKRDLWKLFIALGTAREAPHWVDGDFLGRVAEHDMNGRQIKNAVRVAYALAHDKKRELLPEDIFSVLRSGNSFEANVQPDAPLK